MNYPIKDSTYQHYKGNFYLVICVAKDTETQEQYVIYRCISTGTYYSRSLPSFFEDVNGVPRFTLYFNALCCNQDNNSENRNVHEI